MNDLKVSSSKKKVVIEEVIPKKDACSYFDSW